MNYLEESLKLIDDIRNKIAKLFLTNDEYNYFLNKIDEISNKIRECNDEFNAYELFLQVVSLEKELKTIITVRHDVILPPYEGNKDLDKKITNIKNKIAKKEMDINFLRLRIMSYLLALSIFLTGVAYIINKNSRRPNEKLYLTEKYTYLDSQGRTKHSSEYLKPSRNINQVTIKKIMPWVKNEHYATRQEYTYKIKNMTYDEIINSGDYENIVANLRFSQETNTKELHEIENLYKYNEPIYEVTEIVQRNDQYIERERIVSGEAMLAFFAELMVYLLIVDINNGPLLESIIVSQGEINADKKIVDSDKETLKILKKQKEMIKKK